MNYVLGRIAKDVTAFCSPKDRCTLSDFIKKVMFTVKEADERAAFIRVERAMRFCVMLVFLIWKVSDDKPINGSMVDYEVSMSFEIPKLGKMNSQLERMEGGEESKGSVGV
jgi:hypothetical protein